jgi:hypothetical protein
MVLPFLGIRNDLKVGDAIFRVFNGTSAIQRLRIRYGFVGGKRNRLAVYDCFQGRPLTS